MVQQDSHLPPDLAHWTKSLVQQYNLRAGKRLGQHFLIDRSVLRAIVQAAHLTQGTPVLEIGGGFGVLTLTLLDHSCRVVTVELDARLAAGLAKLASVSPQLTVLTGDVLKLSDATLQGALGSTFDIVANLPYEISGACLRRFLSGSLPPRAMTVLLQREVGERLTARPGEMSLLSLLAELACIRREVIRLVPPSSFLPPPRVTSCLVRLELKTLSQRVAALGGATEARVWQLARIGFAARRKLLRNNLDSALHLPHAVLDQAFASAELSIKARAQELSLAQWAALAEAIDSAATAG